MNPETIIESIKEISEVNYRDGEQTQQLLYRINLLESKFREICHLHDKRIQFFQDEIVSLKKIIDNLT